MFYDATPTCERVVNGATILLLWAARDVDSNSERYSNNEREIDNNKRYKKSKSKTAAVTGRKGDTLGLEIATFTSLTLACTQSSFSLYFPSLSFALVHSLIPRDVRAKNRKTEMQGDLCTDALVSSACPV